MQVGGGITLDNAVDWLDFGASHVIVTSCVFKNGMVDHDYLTGLV
jgi:phosphoribosylformimino-5-aminoimidazole carboxamide ribotide isomerase